MSVALPIQSIHGPYIIYSKKKTGDNKKSICQYCFALRRDIIHIIPQITNPHT